MKKYYFETVKSTSQEKLEDAANTMLENAVAEGWTLKEHRLAATSAMGATIIASFVFEKDE